MLSGGLISVVDYYVPFMWPSRLRSPVHNQTRHQEPYTDWPDINFPSASASTSAIRSRTLPPSTSCLNIRWSCAARLISFRNNLGPVLVTNIAQALFVSSVAKSSRGKPEVNAPATIRTGANQSGRFGAAGVAAGVKETYSYALMDCSSWPSSLGLRLSVAV